MTAKREPRIPAAERRRQLLEVTCRVIAGHGVRGLRVEEVAAQAGVSTTLLYYYFANRAGLLAATLDFVSDRAGSYTTAPAGHSGREQLLHQVLGEFQDTEPVRENSAIWGEFRASAVFDAKLRAIVAAATDVWNQTLAAAITRGQQDNSIHPDVDPADAAERLTALVEGLSNRWLTRALSTPQVHRHIRVALEADCPAP